MDKNIQKIDKYLKNINLPEYESNEHRDTLRRQVINRTQRTTIMKNPIINTSCASVYTEVKIFCGGYTLRKTDIETCMRG